jgi:hypothetical protein
MSADNGAILRKLKDGTFEVSEYNASTGHEYAREKWDTIDEAINDTHTPLEDGHICSECFDDTIHLLEKEK